ERQRPRAAPRAVLRHARPARLPARAVLAAEPRVLRGAPAAGHPAPPQRPHAAPPRADPVRRRRGRARGARDRAQRGPHAERERPPPPGYDAPRDGARGGVPAARRAWTRRALAPHRAASGLRAARLQRRADRAPPPPRRPRHARAAARTPVARRDPAAGGDTGPAGGPADAGGSGAGCFGAGPTGARRGG